jgi:hypothetical protein
MPPTFGAVVTVAGACMSFAVIIGGGSKLRADPGVGQSRLLAVLRIPIDAFCCPGRRFIV